jgi:hypothetical protein
MIKKRSKLPFANIIHKAARNRLINRIAGVGELNQPIGCPELKKKMTEKEKLDELDELLGSESNESLSNSSNSSSSDDIDFDL